AWFGFRRAIVGRSVTVPDFAGKTPQQAVAIATHLGLRVEEQSNRSRYDERVPADHVLLQDPEAGSLAKPSQVVRLLMSLGPGALGVPAPAGLAPRAAAVKLSREPLELGSASWSRAPSAPPGIVAQAPEPDAPAGKGEAIRVLMSRGPAESRIVMPDFVGQ